MEEHLRQQKTESSPQEIEMILQSEEDFSLVTRLIAERIRCEEQKRQQEIECSTLAAVSFRIPTELIDLLLGVEDQQALLIAFQTETEFMLPRRFQSSTFTINGYEHNIRKALRMIEEIINEECCNSHSPTYAFVPDPNADESGTDFILCNGPIREARYRPGREGMHRG
ncbi:hypothetical protein QQG55_26345 [Brugia pahangi]|uniref:KH_dom_type_1 domain-containing protein n=1 Tax=Brugia pahangi TaxID=6280 RepID=A0A0N4T6I1_BRUPA|nr:unnamed protein product [Brugia pahangi]